MNENTRPDNEHDDNLLLLEPVDDDEPEHAATEDPQGDHDHGEHDEDDAQDDTLAEDAPEQAPDTQPAPNASPLDQVLSLQGFIDTPTGRRFFASTDSLRWFLRVNRRELIEAGALIMMGRRTLVCRPQIDHEVIRIGHRNAMRSLAT